MPSLVLITKVLLAARLKRVPPRPARLLAPRAQPNVTARKAIEFVASGEALARLQGRTNPPERVNLNALGVLQRGLEREEVLVAGARRPRNPLRQHALHVLVHGGPVDQDV